MAYERLDWKGRVIAEGAMSPPSNGEGIGTLVLLAIAGIAGAMGLLLFGGKKR